MKAALLALALLAPAGALAQTAEPMSAPSRQKPVPAFADDKPNCREWTDGCIICKRLADGAAACSTVGAACLPTDPFCSKTAP